ncbi:7675_t:CDS:2, partial [Paraglomus occultum]
MLQKTNVKALDDFISANNGSLSLEEAIGVIDKITPEQIQQASIHIAKNPPKKENFQEAFDQDIKNLTNDFKLVEELYKEVYTELLSVDSSKIGGQTTWAPQWKRLWLAFTDLITQSKTEAANISEYAKRHVTVLLPYLASDGHTKEQKIKLIDLTLDYIKQRQCETEDLSKKIVSHETAFAIFQSQFGTWAEEQNRSVAKAITATEAEIQQLQGQITDLTAKITNLADKWLNGSLFVAFGAGVLGFVNPLFCIAAAIAIGGVIGCSSAIAALISVKNDLQQQLDDKKKSLSNLKQQQQNVENAQAECTRLNLLEKCKMQDKFLSGEINEGLVVESDYQLAENVWNVLANSLDLYIREA